MQTYFNDIHSSNSNKLDHSNFKQGNIGNYTLIHDSGIFYIIKNSKVFDKMLFDSLNTPGLKEDTIPLLVSRPITVQGTKQTTIVFLNELGFETDFLSKETLVVRTFPQVLQKIPYLKIVEFICKKNISSTEDLFASNFHLEPELYQEQISHWVSQIGLSTLLKTHIATPLTEKKLKRIYEE